MSSAAIANDTRRDRDNVRKRERERERSSLGPNVIPVVRLQFTKKSTARGRT